MSHYQTTEVDFNKEQITDVLATLSTIPLFNALLSQDPEYKDLFSRRVVDSSTTLSALSSLLSSVTPDDIKNLDPDESGFIKKYSILYNYFRYSFKTHSSSLLPRKLTSDFALMCMLTGIASGDISNTNSTEGKRDSTYRVILVNYQGTYVFPADVKRILKALIDIYTDMGLYSKSSGLKINFLQKAAIRSHGYQYVMMGNLISSRLNTL